MIDWLINYPLLLGLITVLLVLGDWMLTVAQEKEVANHYFEHYQSYPTNTIEGNPTLQKSVKKRHIVNPKQFIVAIVVGVWVAYAIPKMSIGLRDSFLGYVWGLFLIVITQHLSNLIGYKAGRKGIHGKLWMHQRTGFIIQSGRYFSTSFFLLILSILSESHFIYGVTIAGFTSAIRQYFWIRKVPKIKEDDRPPNQEI